MTPRSPQREEATTIGIMEPSRALLLPMSCPPQSGPAKCICDLFLSVASQTLLTNLTLPFDPEILLSQESLSASPPTNTAAESLSFFPFFDLDTSPLLLSFLENVLQSTHSHSFDQTFL